MKAEDFFSPWEGLVSDWPTCVQEISDIQAICTPRRELAWRGVVDASYALHSSLYRRLMVAGAPPDEGSLLSFEKRMLRSARRQWRYDNLCALETLAHIQHFGGPTRLLDVSFNPLIALWFAVEEQFDRQGNPIRDVDGRLFAFDTTDRHVSLDSEWGIRDLPWGSRKDPSWHIELPMVWRPPSYNPRIPAQNSAFLLGGVPKVHGGTNAKYRKAPGDATTAGTWKIHEVREATSVTVAMNALHRRPHASSRPTFTLRIEASAKRGIRETLERHYGFGASTLYPDLYGLAQHVANSC